MARTRIFRPKCANHPHRHPIAYVTCCGKWMCSKCYNDHVPWDTKEPRECGHFSGHVRTPQAAEIYAMLLHWRKSNA